MTERRKRLTRRLPPSGWRHSRKIEWYDQDGRRHVTEQRVWQLTSLAAIPARDRLVDVFDAQEHQVATLMPGAGNGPPLLYVPGADRPTPAFVLVGDQLAGAIVSRQDGGALVAPMGTPRDEFPVWCEPCRREFTLSAAELDAKRPARPTRRTPRVYVH